MIRTAAILLAFLAAACSAPGSEPQAGAPVILTTSTAPFDATLASAKAAIDARGFKTFAVIDHAAGAASAGLDLPPTTLIVFGDPKGGTPLMQAAPTMAIDLPLKLLVYETADGAVMVARPDIERLAAMHGAGDAPPVAKIRAALAAIAAEAAGN